jgi:hypothetical protein
MQKYLATNNSATATSTENTTSSAQLLDRPASGEYPANPANLLPATATAPGRANPVNVPATLPSLAVQTNTIGESPQFLNPTATTPESSARFNSRVPSLGEINAAPATVAMPKNPYQTNLYGSGVAPEFQPAVLPAVAPGPIPLLPNVRQLPFPSAIGESKIISPQVSPNSANSEFQPAQSNQLNLPSQPNFGAVPQNNNNQGQQIQPQPFATPRSLTPGRYIGGGEINTFANP